MKKTGFFVLLAFAVLGALSCGGETNTALLWTDAENFAFYADFFNASQNQYKVEVRYYESPAQKLAGKTRQGELPDIVAASWLKSSSTRTLFSPLDGFFKKDGISPDAFYPRLLSLGKIDGRQYLLPVSFNIPSLVFARENAGLLSNPFTIDLEETKVLGGAYNQERGGVFTRMGFSPAWDDDFLFITAALFNTGFREADPLAWDSAALESAMDYARAWIEEVNAGFQMGDDFTFKYFYEPQARLLSSGRILFAYMNSAAFFTQAAERREALGFRWIAEKDSIPLIEGSIYYGIARKAKAKKAAAAFTRWFFQQETQRLLMEQSRNFRLIESSFGIAGGFSAMQAVTEQVFPQFYPSLLGQMPPGDFLSPANILPLNWTRLKDRVILPYLHERIRHPNRNEIRPLEQRISDWYRLNRE